MDSGACASVIHPDMLPAGVVPPGNPTGQVFHGVNNSPIRRFGHAVARMKDGSMDVGCGWQVAEVSRPRNSVAEVCGPIGHEVGHQDVLFNNKTFSVVPPGVVAAIMQQLTAVAENPREGNLYLAEVELSSFTRQAQVSGQPVSGSQNYRSHVAACTLCRSPTRGWIWVRGASRGAGGGR